MNHYAADALRAMNEHITKQLDDARGQLQRAEDQVTTHRDTVTELEARQAGIRTELQRAGELDSPGPIAASQPRPPRRLPRPGEAALLDEAPHRDEIEQTHRERIDAGQA